MHGLLSKWRKSPNNWEWLEYLNKIENKLTVYFKNLLKQSKLLKSDRTCSNYKCYNLDLQQTQYSSKFAIKISTEYLYQIIK